VPGVVVVDVEARIRELVDRHRDELIDLVDLELTRQLDRLVAERIAARNGAVHHDDAAITAGHGTMPQPTAGLCVDCGTRAPAPGRHVCHRCRGRRRRERRAQAAASAAEPPRAA
jgi:hypothetical protein